MLIIHIKCRQNQNGKHIENYQLVMFDMCLRFDKDLFDKLQHSVLLLLITKNEEWVDMLYDLANYYWLNFHRKYQRNPMDKCIENLHRSLLDKFHHYYID